MSYTLALDQTLDVRQDMRQHVSARLIAAATMLGLSSLDLQQTIERELSENPALEADEVAVCDTCGTPLRGSICPTCLRSQRADLPDGDEVWDGGERLELRGAGEPDVDPLLRAEGRDTLGDRLLADLGLVLRRADKPIAAQVVGNLDEHGFLAASVEEIADACGVDTARVEAVLSALQSLEPVGVGARDLRECLLIQIDHLAERGIAHPLVRAIVADHWTDLAGRKVEPIARALRVATTEVSGALLFVRQHLNPYPAQGHAGPEAVAEARATYAIPDVAIVASEDGFQVEVIEGRRLKLRVSSAYRELARRAADLSDADRAHVARYTGRAAFFIHNVDQRRRTVKKICAAIIAAQPGFLRHGIRHLRPLTRMEVAARAGMGESTVSRATNGKSVLLPSGQVVPFDTFFRPALAIHDVMRELMATEARPMTDGAIGRALAARGIHIARRTVTKYRLQMGALASAQRTEPWAA